MPADALEGNTVLTLEGVAASFGGETVLAGVDLEVRGGEIVTLIGPNGSGKTTLARLALGLVAPAAGTVHRAPGLKIGYVPQRWAIEETLPITVRRFLALAGVGAAAAARDALAEVGAAQVLDTPLQGLSGGEARRVLLARALLREPDFLVLDEPMAGVDLTGQADLYDLIRAIRNRRGCAVLLVSHDLHLVMAATDRVVCLNHHVCCSGTPEAVSRNPEYLALFGPRLAGALALYSHAHDHDHDLSGQPVELAGGPEHGHGGRTHG
jgi:zinc transport system ATP-binding protein